MTVGSGGMPEPPALAEWLLHRCLPTGVVGRCVLGDLRQEFVGMWRAAGTPSSIRLWYWSQAVAIGVRYLFARLRREHRTVNQLTAGDGFSLGPLRQDIKYAARGFRKKPAFALTVILIMGLGIGATTTIFSVVDGVLLRDLPYPEPDRLVRFGNPSHPAPLYVEWLDRTSSFATLAAVDDREFDLTNDGTPESITAGLATASFFSMLGATPDHGRLFADDDFVGEPRVALLSHRFWMRRWGGDEHIIGTTITLNENLVEIVGVLARSFQAPEAIFGAEDANIWLPLDIMQAGLYRWDRYSLEVLGRLQQQVSRDQAQAELDALSAVLADQHPDRLRRRDGSPRLFPLVPLKEATVGDVSNALIMLFGATTLMLLIACANVANLFLARSTDRNREMALRSALGAGRRRVVGQLLTESVTLSVIGASLGVVLAVIGVKAFQLFNPGSIPRIDQLGVDVRVLAFALLAAITTGILFGLAPAIHATRTDVTTTLKDGAASTTAGRRRFQLRSGLVVMEVAMALMLLTGAGLLFNSFVRLKNVDSGFDPSNVIAVLLNLGPMFTEEQRLQFTDDVIERIQTIPGVETVGAGATLPMTDPGGGMCCWYTRIDPLPETEERGPPSIIHPVTPGYFETLSATIVHGRALTTADNDVQPSPAIVNLALAQRLYGETNVLGKELRIGETRFQVVGVAAGIRHWELHRDIDVDIYVPHGVFGGDFRRLQLAVKTTAEPATMIDALRSAVWEVNPNVPADEIYLLPNLVSRSIAGPRFYSALLLTFATIAIVLAAAGIYGSFMYTVSQRHRELGIRLALGAHQRDVLGMVLRSGLILITVGVGLGLLGSFAISQTIKTLVFGITPTDPSTLATVSLLLIAIALAACYLPARKAAAVDPMETLR